MVRYLNYLCMLFIFTLKLVLLDERYNLKEIWN